MLSKFLMPCSGILTRKVIQNVRQPARKHLIPPSQYDTKLSNRLYLPYVLRVYWETIPLFLVTCTSLTLMTCAIAWALKNKVDVVYSSNCHSNISRTMNLRRPTVHKIVIINQRYEPWPEMQDVLDKMEVAEKRMIVGLQPCNN